MNIIKTNNWSISPFCWARNQLAGIKYILKLHAGTYFEPILGHKFTEQNSVMLKEFSLDAIKLLSRLCLYRRKRFT